MASVSIPGRFLAVLTAGILLLGTSCTNSVHKPYVAPSPTFKTLPPVETVPQGTAAAVPGGEPTIEHVGDVPAFERVPPEEIPPVIEPDTGAEYRIEMGDVLDLSIYGEEDLQHVEVPVRPDGRISFAFIGDVQAVGRTVEDLRKDITQGLAKFLRSPEVMVIVKDFAEKKVYVGGEVSSPGVYFLEPREGTLLDALYKVGLQTDQADLDSAYLLRHNRLVAANFSQLIRGDMAQNVRLMDHDLVYVPKAKGKFVYVLGEVRLNNAFEVEGPVPFIHMLSLSGGFNIGAQKREIAVVRGGLREPLIAKIDAKALLAGDMRQNIMIHPGDIIYVPQGALGKYLDVLDVILRTLAPFVQGIIITDQLNPS